MNEQLRIRIQPRLVKEATQVFDELGITPTTAVSMFFAQVVKVRGVPFRPSEFPALEEYGPRWNKRRRRKRPHWPK
jgi:addiction module RelB/DinJ family antitoxin